MRYFATADDQELQGKKQKTGMTEVEEQILGNDFLCVCALIISLY